MELNNQNKSPLALILGGSSGFGLAAVKKLYNEGFTLFVVHRDRRQQEEEFLKIIDEIKIPDRPIFTFNVNALKKEAQTQVLDEIKNYGKLDVFIHSLAWGNLKPLVSPQKLKDGDNRSIAEQLFQFPAINSDLTLTSDDFNLTLQAMAVSIWDWTSEILQKKLWADNGLVIGLTSEGSKRAWPYYAAVSSAKASLEAICRSMALELAPYGIRTNIIQGGVTDTPALRLIPGSETLKIIAQAKNPMGRLTQPEDVANVIYLLTRKEAYWINGAIIPVDGGESLR